MHFSVGINTHGILFFTSPSTPPPPRAPLSGLPWTFQSEFLEVTLLVPKVCPLCTPVTLVKLPLESLD